MPDFDPWVVLESEVETPIGQGGSTFCGVTEERFAISGVTYQWPRGSRLTWGIEFSRLGQLSDMDVKDAVEASLKEISACSDVAHAYVKNPAAANLRLTTRRLDGPSGVLADFQIPVGNVAADTTQLVGRFDDSENWILEEKPKGNTIDFYRVCLHELLHGHGLGHKPHSIQVPALISPMYSPLVRVLQDADKSELIRRYGPPQATPVPVPPTPGVPDQVEVDLTLTFNGSKYRAAGNAKRIA